MAATSYAGLHRQQHERAKVDATTRPPVPVPDKAGRDFRSAHRVRFDADKARLSGIRSLQARAERKRELLDGYRDYIQLALNGGTAQDADVFVGLLIWAIDAGVYGTASTMAVFALENQLPAPDGFTRRLPEIIAEEFASAVLRSTQPDAFTDSLQALAPYLDHEDMADPVRAKFCKAVGMALQHLAPDAALQRYQQAQQHNPRISVKRLIRQLENATTRND
ncbi:MAG: phage terminase small subunit [Thiolinea sp.]